MTQIAGATPSNHMQVLGRQLVGLEAAEVEAHDSCRRELAHKVGVGVSEALEDARHRLFDIQDRIAAKRVAMAQIEGAEAQAAASRLAAERDAAKEDSNFWKRRFILSLSIANGTAFVGLSSALLDAPDPVAVAVVVAPALWMFGLGLLSAGVMPGTMWLVMVVRGVISPAMGFVTGALALASAAFLLAGLHFAVSMPAWLA